MMAAAVVVMSVGAGAFISDHLWIFDQPEGARLEAQGSVSIAGFLEPRLTLTGDVKAAFGLGAYDQDHWSLGGEIHFAADSLGRGFGLDLDARLSSLSDVDSPDVGVRAEASYGHWSETLLGIVRPYVSVTRYSGDGSVRRSVGLDLLDTPASQVTASIYDHSRDGSRALELTLRHRY